MNVVPPLGIFPIRALVLLALMLCVVGCSYTDIVIEKMAINTNVGPGCTHARGTTTEAAAQGQAGANVLEQGGQGAAAGTLVEMTASVSDCTETAEDDASPP